MAEEQASKVLAKLIDVEAAPVTDSVSAMRGLAGQLRSVVDAIGQRLDEGDLDGPRERAWIRAVRELRQLLADMERLGIAGRELEWKQGQAQVVVSAVMSMLEFVPVEQRDQAVRGALEALGIEDDDVVVGEVVAS